MQCLVGREICLFSLVDAGKAPAKQRTAMVALAVRRAAPFADPDFGIAWFGDTAAVWFWSRARALSSLTGEQAGNATFVPEALFTGTPSAESGAELLALTAGFEGRAWKQGRLVASRWWPEIPSAEAWRTFERGASLPPTGSVPEPLSTQIAARPWPAMKADAGSFNLSALHQLAPRATLAIGAFATVMAGYEVGAIGRSLWTMQQAKAEAEALDEPLKRILTAREQADAYQAEIAKLLTLRAAHSQLALIAEISRVIPPGQWRLLQWQQPAPGRVEATIATTRPDPEALVAALEASPIFSEVSTALSSRRNEITISARTVATETAP